MPRRSLAAIPVALLALGGCKESAPPAAPPPPAAAEPADRAPEPSVRAGRLGLAQSRFAVQSDPAAPELEDAYELEAENDGGAAVQAPPRPAPGALPGDRSFSIGPPNGGWLINGKTLPLRGDHHRVLTRTQKRGWVHGSDDLVRIIQEAAAAVARKYPGSVLRVGNLSKEGGGKIGPSVSHQSGRDVDIGLYATDLDGSPVDPPGFPKFDGDRIDTTRRFLFDTRRNWAFVQALLTDERARVQWVFVDTPLKRMMIDYAVRTQVSPEVLDKAEKVLVRPRDSSPHANHFHIRIFCTDGDIEFGCRDYGPEWKWVKESRAVEARLLEDRVNRIMSGEESLDLSAGAGGSAPDVVPKATSPDQLPDPPTNIEIKL